MEAVLHVRDISLSSRWLSMIDHDRNQGGGLQQLPVRMIYLRKTALGASSPAKPALHIPELQNPSVSLFLIMKSWPL